MLPSHPEPTKLVGRFSIDTQMGAFLGATRVRLLEAIGRHGSISRASKAVPMSYKTAWDAIDAMNNLSDRPLVETSVGGPKGGGARLTAYGVKLIAVYRAMEQEYREAMERLMLDARDVESADLHELRRLLRRMSLRSSTRNQFVASVAGLASSDVSVEVRLRVDDRLELAALVTRESADGLQLAVGREVHAFIKASSVILSSDRALRASAANRLEGQVARIHAGAVEAEVTILVSGGRTVTALVAQESLVRLGLAEGAPVSALFKASSVVLATLD